jgi:signal transduction histidine kinase
MVVIFFIFLIINNVRDFNSNLFKKILPYSFIADIILLVLLDNSSKFLVNYYFNIYYFYVLISAGAILMDKMRWIISFSIIIGAFIKYYKYIESIFFSIDGAYYNFSFILSYMIFTFVIFVTIAVVFNYSRFLSEEKELLDKLNLNLKESNKLLLEKNELTKKLAKYQERNRLAHEIHDSLGHNLTGLVMNLEICEKLSELKSNKLNNQIKKAKDLAKENLVEVRRSIKALKPPSVEKLPLISAIEELCSESENKFNINIARIFEGETINTNSEFNMIIYRLIQESITNSIKHGKSTKVDITISYKKEKLLIFIKDNGEGTKLLKYGNGLTNITEKIKNLNGKISFYTLEGFIINIRIPLKGEDNDKSDDS